MVIRSVVRAVAASLSAAVALSLPVAAMAQPASVPAATAPPGWRWALDAPARHVGGSRMAPTDSTFDFVNMAPGWHITMGPGGALYDARERVDGRFAVEGQLILFPDASANEYGVFVGGRGLDGVAPEWTAFVVRRDGSAAVMRRTAAGVAMLSPWAAHEAVKALPKGETVTNVVSVRAEPDSVRFFVNGQRILAVSRSAMAVDGQFGFRIGQGVNLHITNLDVTRRLAPFPVRK